MYTLFTNCWIYKSLKWLKWSLTSLKIIDNSANAIEHYCNSISILHRFWDIAILWNRSFLFVSDPTTSTNKTETAALLNFLQINISLIFAQNLAHRCHMGHSTGNNCKTAFRPRLHVVESVSDEYKIISCIRNNYHNGNCCELVKICHINRRVRFFDTQCTTENLIGLHANPYRPSTVLCHGISGDSISGKSENRMGSPHKRACWCSFRWT